MSTYVSHVALFSLRRPGFHQVEQAQFFARRVHSQPRSPDMGFAGAPPLLRSGSVCLCLPLTSLLSFSSPKKTSTPTVTITGHTADVSDIDWAHCNESRLLTASHDSTIKVETLSIALVTSIF